MEHATEIKVILFDVGGVLVTDGIDEKLRDLAEKYGIEKESLLRKKAGLRTKADRGNISDADFWRQILAWEKITATTEDLEFDSYLKPVAGMLDLARRLARHRRVGILSNDSAQMGRRRREKFSFDEIFDPVIISSAVGMVKPEPGIYRYAAESLGLQPGECLFIDNMPQNIEGARRAGMRAILFEDAAQLERDLSDLGLL